MQVTPILGCGHTRGGKVALNCLYLLLASDAPDRLYVKVGISINPLGRLSGLLTGCPFPPKFFHYIEVGDRRRTLTLEKLLHKGLSFFRSSGEWFIFNPQDPKQKAIFNETLRQALSMQGISAPVWERIDVKAFRDLNRKCLAKVLPFVMKNADRRKAQAEAKRALREYRFG